MKKGPVVIDACCMLNLLATKREVDIVGALEIHLLETEFVSRETLFLWTEPDGDGLRHKEPASTENLRKAGLLETHQLDTEPLVDTFVFAAERVKDSDASCIALAGVLKLPLLTDDRKERRIATDMFPAIELLSTLDVLASAAPALTWNDDDLGVVASDLRWRGNFVPPRKDPRSEWYLALLERSNA
ncbi:MAG TPA: hypothetical protein VJN18_13485 [Polyangiaceae bacterium]|nr:hypothetical protein [Polyangiaceae bacterium]